MPSLEANKTGTGMGLRIHPRDIETPDDDPFKHDLLGRREPAEILTRILN